MSRCHEHLVPVEECIKQAVQNASVTHFDETGVRIHNKLHWLHTASTPALTFLAPHAKRGREALDRIGILPAFRGTTVHDAFASYFTYECSHAQCHAHLLRDLIFVQEQAIHQQAIHQQAIHQQAIHQQAIAEQTKQFWAEKTVLGRENDHLATLHENRH